MNVMTPAHYPGDCATPKEIFNLAREFHSGSETLFSSNVIAPARLLALQAIEGYLIAYARHIGRTNEEVRGTYHDVIKLADVNADNGLALRNRVHLHLNKIVKNREYLSVRYGPEMSRQLSQVTELQSTLSELSQKVGQMFNLKP